MSIVRVGTTQKYSEGWDAIFGRKKAAKKSAPAAKRRTKKTSRRKR